MATKLAVLAILAGGGVLLYLLAKWAPRMRTSDALRNKRVRATIDALGCKSEGGVFRGEFEGQPFRLVLADQHNSPRLFLDVPRVGQSISVTRNLPLTRFWTAIGFSGPIESGDEVFDHDFYVASQDDAYATALVRSRSVRAQLRRLMPLSRRGLRLANGRLVVSLPRMILRKDDGAEQIRSSLRAACPLAAEAAAIALRVPPTPARRPLAFLFLYFGGAAATFAGSLTFIATNRTMLPWDTLTALKLSGWISLGTYVLLQGIVVALVRGRSDAHSQLNFSVFGGLFLVPALVLAAVFGGNAVLDGSPVRSITARIVSLEYDSKGKNPEWDLFLRSWHADRKLELVHPSDSVAKELQGAKEATVDLHDGAYGWERVAGIRRSIDPK